MEPVADGDDAVLANVAGGVAHVDVVDREQLLAGERCDGRRERIGVGDELEMLAGVKSGRAQQQRKGKAAPFQLVAR